MSKNKITDGCSAVNHPIHYNQGSIECIDAMESAKGWFKTAIFCELNDFKYNWRIGRKDRILKELSKKLWYTNKEKELYDNALNYVYDKDSNLYALVDTVKNIDEGNTICIISDGTELKYVTIDTFKGHFTKLIDPERIDK